MTRAWEHMDEPQLVSELRKGNEAAFEVLFDRYKDKAYALSYKILKSKDLADDMVIEVFTKIWKNRLSLQHNLSFQAYLYKVCKNHVINFLNKASRHSKLREQLKISADYYRSSTEEEVIYNEYISIAEQTISQMPKQRKRVFRLKNEYGMTYNQIASELGLSKNTVKSHLLAATAQLRNVVNNYLDESAILLLIFLFN